MIASHELLIDDEKMPVQYGATFWMCGPLANVEKETTFHVAH
jgi:hypothetical protein